MAICLISSQFVSSFLFIDKKSVPKNIPVTPFIDKRFLTNSLSISSFFVISKEIKKLLEDQEFLDAVLLEGSNQADKIASKKMKEMKELVGF